MVPVKKQIIAGSKPEKAEPKRRPRNQALNSSKKETVSKVRRSLNSSMASDLDRLVGAVKASGATDYDDKLGVLQSTYAYEEQLMADAYYKAEQKLSELYGIPNIMLETSVRHGRGRVDAFTDGGAPGCATLSAYDFQDETNAMWDLIKSWSGDTAGLIDAAAQKIVDLVEVNAEGSDYAYAPDGDLDSACGDKLNSSEEPDSVNPSEKDAQSLNSEGGRELTLDFIKQIASTLNPEMPQADVDKMVTDEYEAEKYDHPDYPEPDLLHQLLWDSYGIHEEDVINAPSLDRDYLLSISERADIDYNSSKNQSMNCSEIGERWKTPEEYQEALDESRKAIEEGDNFHKFSVAVDKDGFGSIWAYVYTPSDKPGVCVSVEPDGDGTMIFNRKTAVDINLDDLESVTADLINQAKEELGGAAGVDSSKKQDMNCSAGESGTVYTESGNEIAITDIKVVQNPQTNELALFVPENGDDEIPEGFTVIGTVISDTSETPAIEENAETGDDSLNSSKKPPMNRAQRRAAQRGARRPKKR